MNDKYNTYRIEAERLRLALIVGIERPESIIQWADNSILRESEPNYEIIEISLSSPVDLKSLESRLGTFGMEEERSDAARCVLGRFSFLARLERSLLRRFFNRTCQFPFEISELLDDYYLYCIHDNYSLAEAGVLGTVEKVDVEILSYLKKFESEQSASNSWYCCR